jgi:hypothetical protein
MMVKGAAAPVRYKEADRLHIICIPPKVLPAPQQKERGRRESSGEGHRGRANLRINTGRSLYDKAASDCLVRAQYGP